jgi:hypothetical protein
LLSAVREVAWLRASFALPLITLAVLSSLTIDEQGRFGAAGLWLLVGPPYVLFALTALVLLRDSPASSYYRVSKFLPVLFVPVQAAYWTVFAVFDERDAGIRWQDLPLLIGIVAVVAIPIGYGFVGIVQLIRHVHVRQK